MVRVPTLFFDIGGVLLTNGWDTPARRSAADVFGLDFPEFQTRHEMLKTAFETGRLSLDDYLRKAIFFHPRPFTPDQFKAFMFAQSKELGATLEWVRTLAQAQKYRLYTLNNESRELHEHRVGTFRLGEIFRGFVVSCYLGQAKPDEGIYENALGIAACHPEDAIFIDDRAVNVESALTLGFKAVQFKGLEALRSFLEGAGLDV